MARTLPAIVLCVIATVFSASPAQAWCPDESLQIDQLTVDGFRESVRCLVGERRYVAGRGLLRRNRQLGRAARWQTQAMLAQGFFAHHNPVDGSGPGERVSAAGYASGATRWYVGENLGWGYGTQSTPLAIVTGWMESPPHRANLLRKGLEDIGIGVGIGAPVGSYSPAVTVTLLLGVRKP